MYSPELDVCVYLMSAVAVQMEVEEGANATVTDLLSSLLEEEELGLPRVTQDVLSLWMVSPLLEVQLKPHHKPFFIRREWNHFLQRFSSATQDHKAADEPILSLQRNVFCSKREEQGLKDHRVLELLYEEAKFNILTGRYPCEISDYIMLGGIQARLEIGPYDMGIHTPAFFRQNLERFLPEHAVRKSGGILSWLPWSATSKSSPEARLIEQFKVILKQNFYNSNINLVCRLYPAMPRPRGLLENISSFAGLCPTMEARSLEVRLRLQPRV